MSWYRRDRYIPVAERRAKAEAKLDKLRAQGQSLSPVQISGRKIARTFWGQAWCDNLESYSDYANRMPRGRRYVRNGSVADLQVGPGRVEAQVIGSSLYAVTVKIATLPADRWEAIQQRCSGGIDSLVELLQGKLSEGVMQAVTQRHIGLFPSPSEITLSCSCPDWATMCKHVAASLYGVGARLDSQPELLFALRGVDPADLVSGKLDVGVTETARGRVLDEEVLADVFGIDIDFTPLPEVVAEPEISLTERLVDRLAAGDSGVAELSADLGVERSEIALELTVLAGLGIVVREGSGASARWRLG